MPQIQVLSDLLVNKIAAGEVIERPASVVKELVENSIDSGATRIEIAIEQGGRKLIRVVDDGVGMDREDLALSIQPHATSKITSEEDLFGIRTMGFRGEALPSIGAVSQLQIVSRQASADEAYMIRAAGSKIEPVTAAAGPPGTAVEVRELFFNVPARQKFLRTPQTEMGHITEQLARIALVHPQIEFRLTHNGRPIHHLRPTENMRSRIADFYGKELTDNMLEIFRQERGLTISGFVAPPADTRSSSKWQYVFLNGRFIRDRFVTQAIREAYRGLIEANRYPVIILALQIEPDNVDINVHPTKIEVRWRNSNVIFSQVLSVIRDRFLNTDLTPSMKTDQATPDKTAASDLDTKADLTDQEARHRAIRESIADFFKRSKPIVGGPPSQGSLGTPGGSQHHVPTILSPPTPAEPRDFAPTIPPDSETIDIQTIPDNVIQIHRSYLVAETPDGMLIIDQHALHERILYEQLSEQFSNRPLESQRMLIPETIDVIPDHMEVMETHADTIKQLGFELVQFGPNTIAVHAAPTLLKEGRMPEFVRGMLDRLVAWSGPTSAEEITNDLLSMMACKAAVKAGDHLDPAEIRSLLAQRPKVARSSNCPHGRPTSLRLTLGDIERQFKRT
ncbi:MAG: DNA mismatch repair endonuclease MutL [Planctomycetota bacterium]|nr:MAG: DNA mismatch repair endonuclease MutL [Planctomycetota bacterium]